MKFTWGTGIALTLGAFVLTMAFAVYKVMQQDFDLVTSDYYEKELVYQEKIDQKSNALALGERAILKASDEGILVVLPSKLQASEGHLNIEMYCVTDEDLDFNLDLPNWKVDDLLISHNNLVSGKWIAKITYNTSEKAYFFEPEIYLP